MRGLILGPGPHDPPRTPWLPPGDRAGLLAGLLAAPRYLVARTRPEVPTMTEPTAQRGDLPQLQAALHDARRRPTQAAWTVVIGEALAALARTPHPVQVHTWDEATPPPAPAPGEDAVNVDRDRLVYAIVYHGRQTDQGGCLSGCDVPLGASLAQHAIDVALSDVEDVAAAWRANRAGR